jgi:hypothetical protein
MVKVFKNVRSVLAGACCAAVMCGTWVSMVKGMNPAIESDKKSDSPEFVAVTQKMSDEEYAQAKIKIQELAELAVNDMEKMKELVEFLCDPRIDSNLAVFAHVCFSDSTSKCSEDDNWNEIIKKSRLLGELMNLKAWQRLMPLYFWERYNNGYYSPFLPDKEIDFPLQ